MRSSASRRDVLRSGLPLRPVALTPLVLSLLITAGCQTPGKLPSPTLRLELEPADSVRFGDLTEGRALVSNTTLDPILVRSVSLGGQLPWLLTYPIALGGSLIHRKALDLYEYNPDVRAQTDAVFSDGWLLLPGETLEVRGPFRARRFQQMATLSFKRIAMHDLLRNAYFPTLHRRRPGIYRFRRLRQSELGEYRRAEAGTVGRLVIFPNGFDYFLHPSVKQPPRPIESVTLDFPVPISDPQTPGEIVEASGASIASRVTVSTWLDGPIVDDPQAGQTFLWTPASGRYVLPRCDLTAFDVIDLRVPHGPGAQVTVREGSETAPVRTISLASLRPYFAELASRQAQVDATSEEDGAGGFLYGLIVESDGPTPATFERPTASDAGPR